jgi:predicted Zn-dependent protease
VPFVAQEKYYCGPAALSMALAWSGAPVDQERLAGQVYTPGKTGTLRQDMVTGARRQGRLAVRVAGEALPADRALRDLLAEVAAGHPIIVFQNLGLPAAAQWHFAVVTGYDLAAREVVLHSGTTRDRRRALDSFARTWARGDRWAMAVLPPDQLPASADRPAVMTAAQGLERAERHQAAAQAYAAILERWPATYAARIGRGNALYALQRYADSARVLRTATERRPDAPEAWNNLAYAEAARGNLEAALAAAQTALARAQAAGLQGESLARYRDTLADMNAKLDKQPERRDADVRGDRAA